MLMSDGQDGRTDRHHSISWNSNLPKKDPRKHSEYNEIASSYSLKYRLQQVLANTAKFFIQAPFFLPGGHPAGLDGFVGCIDLTYLRDSLTNIRIRVLSPGRPSLGRMPHSPYYFFRGGVHISLFCPPSTCVCMCAVNAGGCVIDLFVQGWASTSSLLCLVTGNSANTDNSPVPTSPFCIPPYQAWRVAGGRWKITSDTLTLFRRTAPTGNRTRVASVIGQSVNH